MYDGRATDGNHDLNAPRYPGLDWVLGEANNGLYDPKAGGAALRHKLAEALNMREVFTRKGELHAARMKLNWETIARRTATALIR